jgi:hypothetical protein
MAISTSSYFSNSLVGVPQVAGEVVDIYDTNATPKLAIGTKYERQDGAVFRYAHFAAATSAGFVVASVATDLQQLIIGAVIETPASTYQMPNEQSGVYPGAAGSRYFVTTITSTADQYAGAYVTMSARGGAGYTYRVRGNTVTGTPASGKARFELYDPLVAAVGTDTAVTVSGCRYQDVTPASATHPTVSGVSVRNQAAGYFGWVITHGEIGIWQDAGASGGSAGQLASVSSATAGMVAPGATIATAGTNLSVAYPVIGTYVTSSTGSTLAVVNVSLE